LTKVETLPPAQALEYLCADYLSRHSGDLEKKLEEARQEARLDLGLKWNVPHGTGETVLVAGAEAGTEAGAEAKWPGA